MFFKKKNHRAAKKIYSLDDMTIIFTYTYLSLLSMLYNGF